MVNVLAELKNFHRTYAVIIAIIQHYIATQKWLVLHIFQHVQEVERRSIISDLHKPGRTTPFQHQKFNVKLNPLIVYH